LQQWFALTDPAVEDALYESAVLRRFAGIDLPPQQAKTALPGALGSGARAGAG